MRALVVDFERRRRVRVYEGAGEQHAPHTRHRVAFPGSVGFRLTHGVTEGIAKLLWRERHGAIDIQRIAKDAEAGLQRAQRQVEDAPYGRGIYRYAGRAQASVDKDLGE